LPAPDTALDADLLDLSLSAADDRVNLGLSPVRHGGA
jgi:hypothetical protein